MKKYIIVLLCFLLWNCSEDEIPYYSGKTCIYFSLMNPNNKDKFVDEMNFSFGLLSVMDSVVRVPVTAMGDTVGYDRYFSFVVDSMTGTEGVHFDLPEEGILPAGQAKGYIPITLHRVLDEDSIRYISLRLLPNAEFELNLPETYSGRDSLNMTRATLTFSSSITKPLYWMDSWFGYFSVTKYNLFNELCGKDAAYWSAAPNSAVHVALAGIFRSYVNSKIVEGQAAALRDPQNKQEKGYMTVRGASGAEKIPADWPVVN